MWSRSPKGQRTPLPRKLDFCCYAKQRCWGGSLCKSPAKENAANWEEKRGLADPPKSIAFPYSGERARLEAAGATSPGNPEGHDSAGETHIPAVPFDIFALYLRHVSLSRPRTTLSAPLYPCSVIGTGLGVPSALWEVRHSSASLLVTGRGWGAQGVWWQLWLSELWPLLCLRCAPGGGVKALHTGEARTGKAERIMTPRLHVALWFYYMSFLKKGASLLAQMVENLPAVPKTWVWSWVGKILWRRECLPAPIFLPGEFLGQRSLVGYCPWGGKEWERIEWLSYYFPQKGSLLFLFYHLSRPCSSPSYLGSCLWLDQVLWYHFFQAPTVFKARSSYNALKQQVGEFWMYTYRVDDWASLLCKHSLPVAGLPCRHLSKLCGKACPGGGADLGTKTVCAPPGFKPISTVWITSHEPHVCFGGYKINGWNNFSRCYLLKKNFM